jgi:hypothetical protein
MSELLKRADLFNCHSDGISGKNPADAKLVADLSARVRELEGKKYAKKIATDFYRWWHNQSGTNTDQGFDTYWKELLMAELGITEEDIHETKFPPALDSEYDQKKMDRKYPFFTTDPKGW